MKIKEYNIRKLIDKDVSDTVSATLSKLYIKFTNLDGLTKFAVLFWIFFALLAIVGPELTPYKYDALHFYDDGAIKNTAPPSSDHLLGTTNRGEDVLSRLIYGARPTFITAILGGSIIISIGLLVAITAGYLGGTTDTILMRFTDFAYGVPVIPTAIVLAAFLGTGFITSIVIIGLILWRASARVIRSQVLQIRERPFIKIVQSSGASSFHIARKHILPNVAPMIILFFALGVGDAVIAQAGLAFVGVSSPFVPSYGVMVRNAYNAGALSESYWWSMPPGIMISLTVLSSYLIARSVEADNANEGFM